MPNSPSTTALDRAIEHYAGALHRQVVRVLASRPFDADDVAQSVVVWFLGQPEVLMARYPDPVRLGRVAAKHAAISFHRQQRIQRCEGARLFTRPDGTVEPGRRTVSGHTRAVEGGDELLDLVAQPTLFVDDHVVTQQHCADLLSQLQHGLSAADCQLLLLVDGHGWSINLLASRMGIARETLSRRMSRIRRHVQQNRAVMSLSSSTAP